MFEVARDARFHAPTRSLGMSSARARVVGEALQSDRDVVTAAVQQNALALHFASPRLKRDKASVILDEGHDRAWTRCLSYLYSKLLEVT